MNRLEFRLRHLEERSPAAPPIVVIHVPEGGRLKCIAAALGLDIEDSRTALVGLDDVDMLA